ncbi:MAG: WhiB family transcriptional regulator [Solirubrobacterales bacterium]|nr:WhiB family transcriptional regulator [Solirubrobacterales bacterium]
MIPLEPPPARHREAACRDVPDPDIFYPSSGHTGDAAKAICKECPVRAVCLEWALDTGELYGIWGAHTAKERKALRRAA